MPLQPLASGSVALGATGSGTLTFGPRKYGERWRITRLSTSGTSAIVPALRVYRGAGTTQLVDTTDRGNSAVSETNLELGSGESITCVYSGGTPGAVMTFYVEGELTYGISK